MIRMDLDSNQSISNSTNSGHIEQTQQHYYGSVTNHYHSSSSSSSSSSSNVEEKVESIRFNLPQSNPKFVSRKDYTDKIRSDFQLRDQAIHALTGLGGIGKTQLASHYLLTHGNGYQLVARLSAESGDSLQQDLIKLGKRLIKGRKKVNAERVIDYLSNEFKGKILLLYDNAPSYDCIKKVIPSAKQQHLLVTSRDRTDWSMAVSTEVKSMREEESVSLLGKSIGKEKIKREMSDTSQLISELQGLPLALAQASAYINDSSKTIKQYLEQYRTEIKKRREFLEKELPEHEAVYITFDMNVEAIKKENPSALRLLNLCTYCHADSIPFWFLKEIMLESDFDTHKRMINRFSLLDFDEVSDTVSMHRVSQHVRRLKFQEPQEDAESSSLVRWLGSSYIYDYNAPRLDEKNEFLVHAVSIVQFIDSLPGGASVSVRAYYNVGMFYLDGRYNPKQAKVFLKKSYEKMTTEGCTYQFKAKICRQYAKALFRIDPDDSKVEELFEQAKKEDPSNHHILVDKFECKYRGIVDSDFKMRSKVSKLKRLLEEITNHIDDLKYQDISDWLRYKYIIFSIKQTDLLEKLIGYKEGDISKKEAHIDKVKREIKNLEFWQTKAFRGKKTYLDKCESDLINLKNELKNFHDDLNYFYDQIYIYYNALSDKCQSFTPNIQGKLNYVFAKLESENENSKEALKYMKKSWDLTKNKKQEAERLLFYVELLIDNCKLKEAKELIEKEKREISFYKEDERELTRRLNEIRNKLNKRSSRRSGSYMDQALNYASSFFDGSKSTTSQDQKKSEAQNTTDEPPPKRRRLNPSDPNNTPTDNDIDLSSTPKP